MPEKRCPSMNIRGCWGDLDCLQSWSVFLRCYGPAAAYSVLLFIYLVIVAYAFIKILGADVISSVAAAGGMAIATFRFDAKLPTGEIVVRCVEPRWVMSSTTPLPMFAKFHRTNTCGWELAPTRYLLPIPVGYKGDTLSLRCCPNRLRVKDERVMAFDLPLDSLSAVIARGAGGSLYVREPAWAGRGRRRSGTE